MGLHHSGQRNDPPFVRIERQVMHTLKTPVHGDVPTEVHHVDLDDLHASEKTTPEVWFFVVTALVLIFGSSYLLWAKIASAWPFIVR